MAQETRKIVAQCRKLSAEDAGAVILNLIVSGNDSVAMEVLDILDNMPMEYFDKLLEFDERISALYGVD